MIYEGRRAMVFSAHAADFCSRAGGTIRRLIEAGGAVQVYDMTYGELCESTTIWAREETPSIEEIKAIRKAEIEAAAGVLGASIDCFDFGDCPLIIGPDRRKQIVKAIRAFRPDLVLTHWINDILHPDHHETTQAVIWASRYCGAPGLLPEHPVCDAPEIYCYEVTLGTAPATQFIPDVYVDITPVFDRKMEALTHLATQPLLPKGYEILAQYRALEASSSMNMNDCRYAEGFCRVMGR